MQPRSQPCIGDVKTAIILFPGPVVTHRGFRQSAPRFVRSSTVDEFNAAVDQLTPQFGSLLYARVAGSANQTRVFVKRCPHIIAAKCPTRTLCQLHEYTTKYNLPVHKSVARRIKDLLIAQNLITPEQCDTQ